MGRSGDGAPGLSTRLDREEITPMLRWDRLAAAVALSASLLLPTSLAVGQTAGGGGSTSSGAGTTAGSMGGTGTGSMGSTGSGQFRSSARAGMTRRNQGQGRA